MTLLDGGWRSRVRITTTSRGQVRSYTCPVDVLVTVLGGKWKLLIVYYVLEGTRRNGELLRLLSGVSQKMLTQQLRELEADGIVVRTVHEQVPPRVDYAIAEDQRERLAALVLGLSDWGVDWARHHGATIDSLDHQVCAPTDTTAAPAVEAASGA
jgi:DNA-binding HxlR family transcriptional regulator